jgi:hypothetical protein
MLQPGSAFAPQVREAREGTAALPKAMGDMAELQRLSPASPAEQPVGPALDRSQP